MKKKVDKKQSKAIEGAVSLLYKNIFKLSTPLLVEHYWSVYKELITREDFNDLDDLKVSYSLIQEELQKRGVLNVWYCWNIVNSIDYVNARINLFDSCYEFNL